MSRSVCSSGDLQVDALGGAALVELPGGVQEARSPAKRHGAAGGRCEFGPDGRQPCLLVPVQVRLDAEVAVGSELSQQGGEGFWKGAGAAEQLSRSAYFHRSVGEHRLSGFRAGVQHAPGSLLGGLDVGLVEDRKSVV